MFKNLLKTLSSPLLYYVDKSGKSVFRNYCLFKNTGCLYEISIPKKNAGKTLEYRLRLDKILKRIYFLTPIFLYFVFIHLNFSWWKLFCFELLWVAIVNIARIICSCKFSRHLTRNFGKYQVVEFQPPISSVKYTEYLNLFYSKAIALLIVIGLFFLPSLILKYSIKLEVTKHKFSGVITTSKIYFMLYPKNEEIYDYCAYAKYRQKDFEGAIKYYTTVLNLSGKTFTDKDFPRLANLLYLKKTISSPNDAIDLFNEYSTKKNASILQNSQLLWVKSIFRIENNITEGIIQDYEDLLSSIDSKDTENWFYISSDEAYILYLMREYSSAIAIYNIIIAYAETHKDKHVKDLKTLYAERGFAKRQTGDNDGANADFILSKIEAYDLAKYEPSYSNQEFLLIKH